MEKKKIENSLKFYLLCNKLKDLIRTGWKVWNVRRDRIESVAEHIYGVQMLAIAIYKEFEYELDIEKVIYMLALHELEEIQIGDLTWNDITASEKLKKGAEAVHIILSGLLNSNDIEDLLTEYNERTTKEALFAHHCDKLECDVQAKLYDEEKCVDLNQQDGNELLTNKLVTEKLENEDSWSNAWIEFDRHYYVDDQNFIDIINYLKEYGLLEVKKKSCNFDVNPN